MKLVFLIAIFSVFVKAQELSEIRLQISQNPADCSSYLLEKKENFERIRFIGRGSGEAMLERYVRRFLEQCPNSPLLQQADADLKKVLELRAEHSFQIASYYLDLYQEKQKSGLNGAWARLRQIAEQYPSYSKIERVLFELVKTSLYRNEPDEAKKFYRRLLNEFPFSPYVCEANKLFTTDVSKPVANL